jgi:cytochrome c oxidase cbb3-type subunit II
MNKLTTLFIGFFLTFLSGWLGLVIIPYFQLGQLKPQVNEDTGESYPLVRDGLAERGKQVYQAEGCVYCHTQQLRPIDVEDDHSRGWGPRRTVARDYLYDKPVFLGTMRTGPDLVNIGKRQPSAQWQYIHLYNPRIYTKESTMPPYRYLFEVRKIEGARSPEALDLPAKDAPPAGYEVVPTNEGRALVAYLKSLDHTYALPEAPLPKD